nr:MAG TPA: hypothetical protein [Caudoviricetes sp.]
MADLGRGTQKVGTTDSLGPVPPLYARICN